MTAHSTVLFSRLIILECGDVSSVASSRVWTLVGRGAALLRPGPSLKILHDYPESRWRFRDRHRILFLIENVLFSLSLCIMSTQTLFFLNKEVLIIY